MYPAVRINIETDVSLTVAQISIVSVLLTYAGFGIRNVQNVHEKITSTPTSCFYCNCFIGLATAWIWKKKQQHIFWCYVCSRNMHTDCMHSLHPLMYTSGMCYSRRSQKCRKICLSGGAQQHIYARVKQSDFFALAAQFLHHDFQTVEGWMASWEWTNGWNWTYFTATRLKSSTGTWWTNSIKKQNDKWKSCIFTMSSAARH